MAERNRNLVRLWLEVDVTGTGMGMLDGELAMVQEREWVRGAEESSEAAVARAVVSWTGEVRIVGAGEAE